MSALACSGLELTKACKQSRQIKYHYLPHNIQINAQIVMNNDVAKSRNRSPWYFGCPRLGCITETLARFRHGLQVSDDSVLNQAGLLENSLVALAVLKHARDAL